MHALLLSLLIMDGKISCKDWINERNLAVVYTLLSILEFQNLTTNIVYYSDKTWIKFIVTKLSLIGDSTQNTVI